mgnify:CR=1 FL=1|jgi:ABC-type phosphate/phosphonate transport system substrate-binding protein
MIGNASGKYDLEPQTLEKNIRHKKNGVKEFKEKLKEILRKPFYYNDEIDKRSKMSEEQKRKILTEVMKEFIEKGECI